MALVLKDRVVETSTSSGTGTFTLSGAQTGYQSFSAIGNGNTTYYTIQGKNSDGTLTGEWEVGLGTYNAGTLTRDTVYESSNSGSLVNFAVGLKDVFVDLPAEQVGGGSMTYPGAGIANSTGSAWGTSYSTTGTGTVVALQNSPSLTSPIIDGANPYVTFNNGSAVTVAAGRMWYNGSTGSWNLGMGNGNITQQVGEEIFIYGKASAAITDSPLQIVYHTGTVGASGVITFAPTVAGITDENAIIGVATESIALNGFGRVTSFGVIHGINTTGSAFGETWADDDVIWYNPTTGNPTKVKPVAPNIKFQIGIVISAGSGGSGSFQVLLHSGSQLGGTDSNVQITSPSNGNILTYDGGNGYWKNTSLTAGTAISVSTSTNGVLTINNSAPDQTVALTGAGTVTVTGTYPSFTITGAAGAGVTSVSGTAPIASSGGATPAISISQATTSTNGYLSSIDWNTFNGKYSVGGALGTPSSGTLTNCTSLPVGGITATGTPSSTTYLRGDGTWSTVSASPAGANTQVQYNNSGAFGASSTFTFNGTTLVSPNVETTGGVLADGAFGGTYVDGIVVDYDAVGAKGRISVGGSDGLSFYNNGIAGAELGHVTNNGDWSLTRFLDVGNGTLIGGSTNPIIAAAGSANQYVQAYIHNDLAGTSASSDFAAYPDNGTDTSGWIDMGITSSTYADVAYPITGPNEGYIFMSAPSGASKTGNLVYATDSTGTENAHQWYSGGFGAAKNSWEMKLNSTNLTVAVPLVSTVTTGTAPFTVASTTNVANLNASSLNGATFAAPGAIGGTTPAAITGTTITANTAFSGPLNGTVGATTPSTGVFTQLTVNGANLNTAISPTGTGTVTISPSGALTVNPTAASTIDNVAIGTTTALAGRFTGVTVTAGTNTVPPIKLTAGTNLTTTTAGAIEYDGSSFYASVAASTRGVVHNEQLVVLNTAYTLTSQTAAQKLFNATTNGAVTLPIGTYQFECSFSLTGMSATSGSFGFAMVAGTAIIGSQGWWSMAQKGTATVATATAAQFTYSTAANTTLATASTNTVGYAFIKGIIKVTTAGTVIPSVSLGVASAAVVGINSYFKIAPITGASAANITVGNWS